MKLTLKEIFDKARQLWSLDSQLMMLAEECSELSQASLKLIRRFKLERQLMKGAPEIEKLAEEIADVQLMIDEALYYFKWSGIIEKAGNYRKAKLERLEKRILEFEGVKT